MASHSRVLIVSNRLPVVPVLEGGEFGLRAACGGLATGLRDVHEREQSVWIGWAGEMPSLTTAQRAAFAHSMKERRIQPVHLTPGEAAAYYDGVCNEVLWPLFHYQIDRLPLTIPEWGVYRAINERFACTVVAEYRDDDVIWIHDYHLLLVPGMIRRELPQARIGFFLHIPFPAEAVFRIAPWRTEILHGLLGADVIGFHTPAYAAHFEGAVASLTGCGVSPGRIVVNGREVSVGAYPMGVDTGAFERLAASDIVRAERDALVADLNVRLLVGIDRLDYTKGIPRRLLAYETLLRNEPALRGRVRLIQVAVPSRDSVTCYQQFRREVDEIVGRINGEHGTVDWTPIRYLHQSVSREQLVALYGAADVMVVTPLRDGMNLVAKEFVASRIDGDGVLVLSEFAGAAHQLVESIQVNPYAVDDTARAMSAALSMPTAERRARMHQLRNRVTTLNLHDWTSRFLDDLTSIDRPAKDDEPVLTWSDSVSAASVW